MADEGKEAYRLYDNKEKAFVNQKDYKSESSANKVAERRNQEQGSSRYSAEKYSDIVRQNTPTSKSGGSGMGGGRMDLADPSAVKSLIPNFQRGGTVSASSRADGCCIRGKTKA